MIFFPPAKINLGLNVLFKRTDGYHEILSCMHQIPICDVLEVIPSEEFKCFSYGIEIDANSEDNLVTKAFRLVKEKYQIPNVEIHLLKNIPSGAGLGGGSSDAAYTILSLNEMFSLKLSEEEMCGMAATLGSDCPFFIRKSPQMSAGRGEELSDVNIDLEGYYLKLVHPGIHVSTKEAYQGITFSGADNYEEVLSSDPTNWNGQLHNSFEEHIFKLYPAIREIKAQLYEEGADYALMSGSGSSVYGLFKKEPQETFPNYFERIVQF